MALKSRWSDLEPPPPVCNVTSEGCCGLLAAAGERELLGRDGGGKKQEGKCLCCVELRGDLEAFKFNLEVQLCRFDTGTGGKVRGICVTRTSVTCPDGSIFIFGETELHYEANLGIADAFNLEAPFIARSNISVADFIQFAATISLTKCPGVAQPPFLFGRVDATAPAPEGTVPEPFQSAADILARMADAGLSPADTVALLASHSIAGADDVDPDASGVPFDSTPSLFDTQFFLETLLNGTIPGPNQGQASSPIQGELRLQSDFVIAHDDVTACIWQGLVNNQQAMAQAFQQSFLKMGILGQDAFKLVDCSDVIPAPPALTPSQAQAFFPPQLNINDVQQSCQSATFPNLPTAPGAVVSVPSINLGSLQLYLGLECGKLVFMNWIEQSQF
ncbi:manganese peroxidase 1 precursor [Roridomyces roridus]|uniref:Peroxidase n=1 Tax=Roridomyces roridus TaxID=1738132 RepID=A0AAD7B8S0_9AGAR|nr:manganese peroxidase 1 precursor [Roridomyces roridus]